MDNNRGEFIKKTSIVAALSDVGIGAPGSGKTYYPEPVKSLGESALQKKKAGYVQDTGIKICFAYFVGIEVEKCKVEFGKQLNILGAVGGINPTMAGDSHANPGIPRLAVCMPQVQSVASSWRLQKTANNLT
jgi:mannonate dehydratase